MRKLAVLLLVLLFATAAFAQLGDFALLLQDSSEPRTIMINSSAPPAPKILPASAPVPRPAVTAPATPAPDLFATLAQGLRDSPQQAPAKPAPAEQQLQQFLLESLTRGLAEKLVDPVQLLLEDHRGTGREATVSSVIDPATRKPTTLTKGKRYDFALNLAGTKQLRFGNMLVNTTTRIKFEELTLGQFTNAVAIDLTGLNFANATYSAVARKDTLLKCKLWNFAAQRCDGAWEKLMSLAPGTPYDVALTADDPALAETGGIFFDGFEAGLAFNNWTINGTGAKWTNSTLNPYNGTRHANANLLSSGLPTSLMVNVSTKNFTTIRVSYARRLVGIDNSDEFRARWYNGTAWQVLEQTGSAAANEANYSVRNFTLPASADDNTKFVLEFSCEANLNSEHCRIDDVRINGTPKVDEGVTLTKTDAPDPVQNGTLFNYTLLINVSAGTASNTTLIDLYPFQVIFVNASPAPLTGTNNTFIIGNLTNGTLRTVNITVRVIVNIANNTLINNTANLTFVNSAGVTRTRTATTQTVAVAPPPPSPCRLLFDSFESGLAPSNWTVNGTGAKWTNSTLNPYNGTWHANANLLSSGLPTSLIVNISTANVTGIITVQYARRLVALDGPDEFAALWHNGAAWQVLEQTGSAVANEANYSLRNFTLDSSANNKSILLEFMCAANQNAEHCRIDNVCVNWTTDTVPPSVPETNVSSVIPFVGDSVCLLANVTDQSGVQSVTARIRLPNGSMTSLPLFDGLTCNSPENDSVFSNHLIVSLEGVHTWANISVADMLGNAANVSPNRTFEGLLGFQVATNNMPPNLSRYNNGTVINLALINTSNNVYATQNVPSGAQTFMYFNWTLNITGDVANSNVSIEHSYSGTSSMTSTLQAFSGATWSNVCTLNMSTSDVIDRCDLDSFVNGNVSIVNDLQLRVNTTRGGGGGRTQSVDHVSLGVENATPGAVTGCPVTINQSTTLEQSVTSGNNCITFGADNLDLDCAGFTIAYNAQGGFGDGILATNRKNITIRNCVIRDANITGANSRGANLDRVNDSSIVNTTISTNGTANNHGILIQGANGFVIDNVTVSTRGNESFNVGIYLLTNASRVNVTRSTIRTAGTTLGVGILLENNVRDSRIFNNSITATGSSTDNYGIELATSDANNVIENNTVATNGTLNNHGILLQSVIANTTIIGNTIATRGSNVFNTGIFLMSNVTNTTVARNTVRTNGTGSNHGVLLQTRVSNTTVANNTVMTGGSANFNVGIFVADASSGNALGDNLVNTTGTSDNHGVLLQNGRNTVTGNAVRARGTGSSNEGMFFDAANNVTVRGNIITTNGTGSNHGILLQNLSRDNVIDDNTIVSGGSANFNAGMNIINSSNNNITANRVNTTGTTDNTGIALQAGSTGNVITDNRVSARGTGLSNEGIFLLDLSSNNAIRRNTILTNGTANNHGVLLQNQTRDNIIANNTVTASGSSTFNVGMLLHINADRNVFENNTIKTLGQDANHGFFLDGASDSNNISFNTITVNGTFSFGIGIENISSIVLVNNTVTTNFTEELHLFNTTDSVVLTDTELGNYSFTNASIEIRTTGKGRIKFNAKITAKGKSLKQDIELGDKNITVNATSSPGLNVSADITFESANFTDLILDYDSEDDNTFFECPDAICTLLENNQTTRQVKFNVTHFSRYRAIPALVHVLRLSPGDDAAVLLNETPDIRVNATPSSTRFLDKVIVEITLPNGTKLNQSLLNATKDIYNATFGDVSLRGRYNITFIANDSKNVRNLTVTAHFARKSLDVVDVRAQLTDLFANESDENATFTNAAFANYTVTVLSNLSGVLNLSITLNESRIRTINITNHDEKSPQSVLKLDDWERDVRGSFRTFAIDPSLLNFTNITITVNASGETLTKCADWDFTKRSCSGNWTELIDLAPGQLYTFAVNATDPAFAESSPAIDVSATPFGNETMVVAWVDNASASVRVAVMQTNGSVFVNDTVIDATADGKSRVDILTINETHFIVAWIDGPSEALQMLKFAYNGTHIMNQSGQTIDPKVGTNTDVSIAELDDRFIVCYANGDDSDADFYIFNKTDSSTIVAQLNSDLNMNPGATLQNLVDCAGVNATRWVHAWFDDSPAEDATYDIKNETGIFITGGLDIDNNVGGTGQVAVTAVDRDKFAMVWYDSTDQDVSITVQRIDNTQILAPTDIDATAGTESRVAITAVRENKTSTADLFAVAWWNQSSDSIMAAVFRGNGSVYTPPFVVDTQPSASFRLLDIVGKNPVTNNSLCPGRFMVLYSNSTNASVFTGFIVNGSTWDGVCDFVRPINLSPSVRQTFLLNDTVNITANVTTRRIIDTVYVNVTLPNGTIIYVQLFNETKDIYNATFRGLDLLQRGIYNITFWANNTKNLAEIANATFTRNAFDVIDLRARNLSFNESQENESAAFLFANYSAMVVSNASGVLNLSVTVNGSRILHINVTNHDEGSIHSILDLDDWESSATGSFVSYGTDPARLNFTNSTLLLNASGIALSKCADWNFTARDCMGNWTPLKDIVQGQLYTLPLTPTDPGFSESSPAIDIGASAIDNESVILAWVDNASASVRFAVFQTNGSVIVNDTVIDATADNKSRVDVKALNSTRFVIAWVDGPSQALRRATYAFNGTVATSASSSTIDAAVGTNADVSLTQLDDRYVVCYANDDDNDADFHLFSKSDDSDLVGELNSDLNTNPGATLQNLFDCAGVNATRWVPFWFDDSPSEDATYDIFNETGIFQLGQTDVDSAVGAVAQVAVAAVDNDKFAMAWYDSTDQDVSIAVRYLNNSAVLAPTDIDATAGTESRVAIAAVGENDTSTADLFAIAWWNQSSDSIMAAVFRGNGSVYTPPFVVDTQPSADFRLLDVAAKDPVTNLSLCPGKFIVAYSNSTTAAAFKGFDANGSLWDGICRREARVAFALNQTVYNQGTSLIPATNPEFGVKYFVPFQARFYNRFTGTPISNGACNVTVNNTGHVVFLTFNSSTGNYTGQLDTFNQFGNNTFNVSCTAPGFGFASNVTTAQIVLRLYLIETRNIFHGGDGVNLTNTTTWLSKLPPSSGTAHNRTYSVTLAPNATNVTIADFFICGSHRPLNCSILKDFTMRGNVTMRVNASASANNACILRLCYLISDKNLDPVLRICNNQVNLTTGPDLSEHSVGIDGTTIDSTNFGGFRAVCDAAPGITAETPLNITVYYNYTGEPPNLEITHPETGEIQSQQLRMQQLEAGYAIGPNNFLNATLNITTQFNNTGNMTAFVYARVSRNLPEFEPSIIRNTTVVFNSTNQLWASDNTSQNASQNVTIFAHDIAQYVTEPLPGGNVRNNSQIVRHQNALRSNEALVLNATPDKRWDAIVRHIFVRAVALENVTAFTNYSAFGFAPEDEFGFFVNVTNATGTFDVTNDSIVDRTAKTITFPSQTLANNATFRIKGRDVRGPRVHDEHPQNASEFNLTDIVQFRNNISDLSNVSVALVNITLPNGTLVQLGLGNITNQTFTANFSELIPRGRYNITYVANDSFDNRNDTVRRFFHRKARNIIDIINHSNANINFTVAVSANASGMLDLNITINHTVQRMRVFNHSEASPSGIIRLGGAINEPTFPEGGNFSIDVSDFNFSLINVTRVATSGDTLYKCAHFDRVTQSCVDLCSNVTDEQDCLAQPEGLWVPIANITPGQEYSILFTNASDPGFAEFDTSQRDDETNTTSTTPVGAIRLNLTPDAGQYVLLGYAELQGASQTSAVRSRLILNDTRVIGNLSWQPDTSRTSHPPGDYQPFFSHQLINLSSNSQNLSVEFFTNNSAAAVFIRRARAIAMRVNNSDAVSSESSNGFLHLTPANTFHAITNLSYTPATNQTVLVLASAEVNGNSTANSIFARLLVNGSEEGRAQIRVDAPADIDLFATHLVMNISANVTQNFTLQAQSVTTTNKSIRRARVTVVPLSEVFYNSSENLTITSETAIQDKAVLYFNLTSDSDTVVIGSAELNISSNTNGNFVLARLLLDDEEIGNITMGASSTTDLFSFVTTQQLGLAEGEHTAQIRFRRIGATSNVSIQRARITVIPMPRAFNLTTCPITINKSVNLTQNLSAALSDSTSECIAFGANNIVLDCKGFALKGNRTGRGIGALNRRNVTLRNCVVTNFSDGIFFNNVNGSTVFNVTILNSSDDGIDFNDVNLTVVEQNKVENSFDNGIVLTRSDFNNITLNIVTNASGAATGFCIELFNSSDNNRVVNNTVRDCQDDGLLITANSTDNLALNNTLINSGDDGIGITDSHGNVVALNRVLLSGDDGIALSDGDGSLIENNTVHNNSDDGIFLTTGTSNAIIRDNRIENQTAPGNDGINLLSNVDDQRNNTVENNVILQMGDDAIQVVNRSFNVIVRNNTIHGTGRANTLGEGILIVGVQTGNLTRNNISNTGNRGIRVSRSFNVTAEHNVLSNITALAINLENSNQTTLINNTLEDDETELRLSETNMTDLIDITADNYTLVNASFRLTSTGKAMLAFLRHNITREGKNFSADIVLSNRSIFINTTSAPELNISANVTFFNVNFSEVIIETDAGGSFAECPDTVCTLLENNQSVEQVRFNVTGFSQYQVIPAIINVNQISPSTGQEVLINGSLDIRANATPASSRFLDDLAVNVTLPNGTVVLLVLLNETKDVYNATLAGSDLLQRGRYNLTFLANDSRDIKNFTVKTHFIRKAKDVIDIPKPVFAEVDNETTFSQFVLANYSVAVTANASGMLNLTVTYQDAASRFKTISVANHDERSVNGALQIDDASPQGRGTFASYAVEFGAFNFSTISLTINATGTELSKCGTWNFTGHDCLGNWTKIHNTQPGQTLTLNFTPTDPGFAESSPAVDVAMTPLSFHLNETLFENETFVLAWVDNTTSSVRFRVQHTNGSVAVNDTIVDSTVDDQSRVSVSALNDTHFVVAWIDGPDDDVTMIVYEFNGSGVKNMTGIIDVNANVGTNNDIDVTTMEDRFIVCYANDADNDADFDIYNKSNYAQLVIELNSDLNMNPELPLQNLADCAGVNSTRWVHNWYDAGSTDDDKVDIKNETGIFITGGFAIDNEVGDTGQVAITALNNDKFALVWYDSDEQDITIAIRSINNDIILAPTDIDTLAGNASRVAIAAVRPNQTAPQEFFAITWWNQSSSTIMAAVFNNTGGTYTAPFVVNSSVNAFYQLLEVAGDEPVTNNSICPGKFVVAYSNGTNQGVFAGYELNGTPWEGECGLPDLEINSTLIFFNVTNPQEGENITINATLCNPGNRVARDFNVTFADGNETTGIIFANVTGLTLTRRRCIIVNATYVSVIGNRTISIVADTFLPNGTVKETNESNNLAIRTLNVQATTFYTGTLFGNVTLEAVLNETKYNYGFNDSGNIYIFDINSTFNFSHLQALGRNRSGAIASNDFSDADAVLNQTRFNDSIRILWGGGSNSTPIALRNFTIFNNTILDVPIINSTNSSVFITGILWDMADDTNNEFDTTEREDLVFVGNINVNQSGGLNQTADYEIRIATLVRTLRGSTNQTAFIAELQ